MTIEPKKGIKLSLLVKPQAEVCVGTNTIYLYPVTSGDMKAFSRLPADVDPIAKFRELLPNIASLSVPKDSQEERVPLPHELIEQMPAEELSVLADAYAGISAFKEVRAGKVDEDVAAITRQDGESAVSYVDRLLTAEAERYRRIFGKINLAATAPASKLLEQLKLSSVNLGDSMKVFEEFSASQATQLESANARAQDMFRETNERNARLARERKEELEMNRLTGEMTARSAKLLQDLAKASGDFLLRFDQRSEKADRDTRWQLNVAVGSVVVSAILAVFALGIAIASYQQDGKNNSTSDQWQKDIIELQRAELEKRILAEREVEKLKSQLKQIEKQNKK